MAHGGYSIHGILIQQAIAGAELEITESYVNFGNIACGTSTAHVIHIKNNLSVKAVYQVTTPLLVVQLLHVLSVPDDHG